MPEFAGIVPCAAPEPSASRLRPMLAALCPDPAWHAMRLPVDPLKLLVGWASRTETHAGALPFWNEDRSVGLLLADEEACAADRPDLSPAVAGELTERARVLVQAYQRTGIAALLACPGWFSGMLLDVRREQTIVFNDRYGLGRVYYRQDEAGFYFASSARALLAACPDSRRLDPAGLAEWLTCGCVLQGRTLFPGISLLPPGAAWTLHADGRLDKRQYFEPSTWEKQEKLSPEAFYQGLKEVFPRALERTLRGRQRVAMSLTGGLDGRMIMAWLREAPGELPCYTFNGPVRDCADVRIARQVASACGQPFQIIPIDGEFFARFPQLAAQSIRVSDGAMDVTGAAELFLNQRARAIAPIRLTGNYGSEVVRGNVAFRPRRLAPDLYDAGCRSDAEQAARTYAAEAAGNRLAFIAFKQVPWHHFARFAVERSQITPRSPFLDHELMALLFRAPAECATRLEPSLRLIAEGNPALGRIPTDRGITCPAQRWSNRWQRPLHEFLARAEYAYDYGMPDWLARVDRCLAPLRLERLFLGRQKFCHFRSWYRRELAGFVRDVLLDPAARSRSYLNGAALETLVNTHLRGTRNRTTEIHKLLSLELLHRELRG